MRTATVSASTLHAFATSRTLTPPSLTQRWIDAASSG
jgi:hypothetical protein